MQIPISNFRIPKELKHRMKNAVKKGLALNLSDLVRKAIKEYLERHP